MKKGVEATTLVATLIIFLIIIGGYFFISQSYGSTVSTSSNVQAVTLWVKQRTTVISKSLPAQSDYPPVIQLEPPLEINSRDQLLWKGGQVPTAYKDIADSMVLCWKAFDNGKSDFINTVEKTPFCFKCRSISFSEDIKKEKLTMLGLNNYLNENKIAGHNSLTYMQYFANDKDYNISDEKLGQDKIIVNNDMYIMMFAVSGRGLGNIFSNLIGTGDITTENQKVASPVQSITTSTSEQAELELAAAGTGTVISVISKVAEEQAAKAAATAATQGAVKKLFVGLGSKVIGGPIGWVLIGATAGKGLWDVTMGPKPFSANVMLVDPTEINQLCNAQKTESSSSTSGNNNSLSPDFLGGSSGNSFIGK